MKNGRFAGETTSQVMNGLYLWVKKIARDEGADWILHFRHLWEFPVKFKHA